MEEFDFNTKLPEVGWLVKNLIPISHLCLFLSQAGVGKSLLAESIALHLVHGKQFCNLDVDSGDVLIIDQDTPQNVINNRIIKFDNGIDSNRVHKLYLESMRGYTLNGTTLFTAINDHPSAKLIVIDSLHSVCGNLNPNSTADMNRLAVLKEKCITDDKTIIINHHISEKFEYDINTLMTCDPHKLSMGNSAIIQQVDSYYIIGATAEGGITNRMYMRPVSKRASIPTKPIVIRIIPCSNNGVGESVIYDGLYEPDLNEAERDIMILFREHNIERTVKEVYENMGHRHGEIKVRDALAILDNKGLLIMSRHKSNLFKYKLS